MKVDLRLFLLFSKFICSMVAISFLLVLPITTQAGEIPSAVPGTSVTTLARMLGSGDQSEFKEAHTQLEGLGQSAMPGLIRIRNSGTDRKSVV